MANGAKYSFDMELFAPIVKEESKWNLKGRNVMINISKKDKDEEEWWNRLTKSKVKNQLITIDWARWKDVDDVEEPEAAGGGQGQGDFDPSMMQGMGGGGGGMPGMGGMGGGGMPGMGGGAGGMGGMDMEAMMQ